MLQQRVAVRATPYDDNYNPEVFYAGRGGMQGVGPPPRSLVSQARLLRKWVRLARLYEVYSHVNKRCNERSQKIAQHKNVADLQHFDLKGLMDITKSPASFRSEQSLCAWWKGLGIQLSSCVHHDL